MPPRDPAPGRLGIIEDAINTAELEAARDTWVTAGSTATWLAERDLLPSGARFTQADRRRLVDLREALRLLAAANNGARLASSTVEMLNRHAASAYLGVRFDERGVPNLTSIGGGVRGAIAELLAIVQTAALDGTWSRFKTCRNPACRWAFYDRSRNRSGSWCVMEACGNRAKARSFRARHRVAR